MSTSLDLAPEQFEAAPSDLREVVPDCRQRRIEELSFGNAVEADNAHVVRNASPGLEKRTQNANRHLVVGDEDCSDVGSRAKPGSEFIPEVGASVTNQSGGYIRTRCQQRVPPAREA
jgi:hypothetical protein